MPEGLAKTKSRIWDGGRCAAHERPLVSENSANDISVISEIAPANCHGFGGRFRRLCPGSSASRIKRVHGHVDVGEYVGLRSISSSDCKRAVATSHINGCYSQ